jgi:sRNA-binding carbon storage regulator CsrA
MALLIGRKPGQRVRIGGTTVTVLGAGERTVSVRVRPGGWFTFTTAAQQLRLAGEPAVVRACPHPHRERAGAAQLRITAPASVRVQRPELERGACGR